MFIKLYGSTILLTSTTLIAFGMVGFESQLGLYFPIGIKQIIILLSAFLVWLGAGGTLRVGQGYFLLFFAAVFLLLLPAIFNGVPFFNIALGVFMTLEFALIYILSKSSTLSFRALMQFINAVILILGINAAFAVIGYADDFPAPMRTDAGLQGDAGFFASGLNIGIIALLATTFYRRSSTRIVIAGLFTFIIFLTAIKKAVIISLVIWIVWVFSGSARKKVGKVLFFSALLLIVSIGSFDGIVGNINQNIAYMEAVGLKDHVRFAMYFGATEIAYDYLPFGSGAGTFGSLSSITGQYSHFYHLYGISSIPTNSQEHLENGTHTLLDTYWPHIIAEAGFFGALAIAALMLSPVRSAIMYVRAGGLSKEEHALVFISVLIPIDLAIEGFALYTPESPFFIVFLAGVTGYSISLLERASARRRISRSTS